VSESLWQIPQASTLIRTDPAAGMGISRSTMSKGPSGRDTCATRIFDIPAPFPHFDAGGRHADIDLRIFSPECLVNNCMKVILVTLFAALLPIAVWGQAETTRPQFEVASIRPSAPPGTTQVNVGVHVDGAMVACTALSLKDFIQIAYRVKNYQVS